MYFHIFIVKDMQITKLEDIRKLKVKDLKEILRSNLEETGGIKADLVLKITRYETLWIIKFTIKQQSSNKTTKIFDLGKLIKRIRVS